MADERSLLEKYASRITELRGALPQTLKTLDDKLLLRGLFSRQFNVTSVIELLSRTVKGRKEFPVFFPTQTPSVHFRPELIDNGVVGYVNDARTAEGHHIIYIDWSLWDPSNCDATSFFYTIGVMAQAVAWKWDANKAGFVMMTDVGNIGMKHVKVVLGSPNLMHASMTIQGNVIPANIASYVVNNTNFTFDLIWKVAKGLAPQRVKDRMTFVKRGDNATLIKLLSPEVVVNKTYIPTTADRVNSRQMAEEWETKSADIFNKFMD